MRCGWFAVDWFAVGLGLRVGWWCELVCCATACGSVWLLLGFFVFGLVFYGCGFVDCLFWVCIVCLLAVALGKIGCNRFGVCLLFDLLLVLILWLLACYCVDWFLVAGWLFYCY